MATKSNMLKTVVVVILAIILSFLGLSFVFSDLNQTESLYFRLTTTVLYFLGCAFGIGYFYAEKWLLSLLIAAGSTLFGGGLVLLAIMKKGRDVFTLPDPPYITLGLLILFLPLNLALFGGYLGQLWAHKNRPVIL